MIHIAAASTGARPPGALCEQGVTRWREDLRSRGTDYLFSVNRYCFVAVDDQAYEGSA